MEIMEQLLLFPAESTSSLEERPVRDSALPGNRADSKMIEASSASLLCDFLKRCAPASSYGKMSRGCFPPQGAPISSSSFAKLQKAGIAVPGEFLTLNMSEWTASLAPSLKEEGVCSLSDVLEPTGNCPQKYFLSPRACSGILRRAESRGKDLPPMLKEALERQSQSGCVPESRVAERVL